MREKAAASERRIGQSPARIEVFGGPCGLDRLCTTWYYFDANDRLIDIEMQGAAD